MMCHQHASFKVEVALPPSLRPHSPLPPSLHSRRELCTWPFYQVRIYSVNTLMKRDRYFSAVQPNSQSMGFRMLLFSTDHHIGASIAAAPLGSLPLSSHRSCECEFTPGFRAAKREGAHNSISAARGFSGCQRPTQAFTTLVSMVSSSCGLHWPCCQCRATFTALSAPHLTSNTAAPANPESVACS